MHLLLERGAGFRSWEGAFVSEAGELIATAEFRKDSHSVLTIQRGENCFEMTSTTESFHTTPSSGGGGGKATYNGKLTYSFTSTHPMLIEFKEAGLRRQRIVLKTQIDSWQRRFCWAYRQGQSWFKAWQYASWGNIAIGSDYCFCSFYTLNAGFRMTSNHMPCFNEEDERVWSELKAEEQMLILALSVFHICGTFVGKKNSPFTSQFSRSCPNVPSYAVSKTPGLHCSIDPSMYRRRWFGEFWAVGNPIAYIATLLAGMLYYVEPCSGTLGVLGMVAAASLVWMVISRAFGKYSPKEW